MALNSSLGGHRGQGAGLGRAGCGGWGWGQAAGALGTAEPPEWSQGRARDRSRNGPASPGCPSPASAAGRPPSLLRAPLSDSLWGDQCTHQSCRPTEPAGLAECLPGPGPAPISLGPRPQAPGPSRHSLRPPLEGGHCEQGHHGRQHVVKVEFVVYPLAGVQLYLRGVPILVHVVIAPDGCGETWSPLHAAMLPPHVLWVPGSECAGEMKVQKGHHWALPSHWGEHPSCTEGLGPQLPRPPHTSPVRSPLASRAQRTCTPPLSSWTSHCS